jgi:hypothetical protein
MKRSKESGKSASLLKICRMTLRSREVKSLESACAEIVARSKN